MTAPTIVGAYAAMPRAIAERECLYRSLAETGWVDGIEIPYRDGLDADPRWLADQLRDRFAHCVVTAIPGTMGQLAGDPDFGLASSDEQGRQRALKWFTNLVDDVRTLHEMVGHPVVRWVEVHSAPSRKADAKAFASSLVELTLDLPSSSSTVTRLVASDRARRSSSVWTTRSPRWSVRGCT